MGGHKNRGYGGHGGHGGGYGPSYPPQGGHGSGHGAPLPYGGQPYTPQGGQPLDHGAPTSYGSQPYPAQWTGDPSQSHSRSGLPRAASWLLIAVGMMLWSGLSALAYVLVDPFFGWLGANAGLLVDQGAGLATTLGAGKETTGNIINNFNMKGVLGQTISVMRSFAKPAVVIIWAIGAFLLLAGPSIRRRMGGFHGARWR